MNTVILDRLFHYFQVSINFQFNNWDTNHSALGCEVDTIWGKSIIVMWSWSSNIRLNSLKSPWIKPWLASLTMSSMNSLYRADGSCSSCTWHLQERQYTQIILKHKEMTGWVITITSYIYIWSNKENLWTYSGYPLMSSITTACLL